MLGVRASFDNSVGVMWSDTHGRVLNLGERLKYPLRRVATVTLCKKTALGTDPTISRFILCILL